MKLCLTSNAPVQVQHLGPGHLGPGHLGDSRRGDGEVAMARTREHVDRGFPLQSADCSTAVCIQPDATIVLAQALESVETT